LIFNGDLEYAPHLNGLEWFRDEILPRLRRALPQTHFILILASQNRSHWVDLFKNSIPSHPSSSVVSVEFIKYESQKQLMELLSQGHAVLYPLRYGRGNRVNLLESALCKVPIVSTGKGADGLLITPGVDYYLAEDADHFTSQLLQVLRDPSRTESTVLSAYQTVKDRFDWNKTLAPFVSLLSYLEYR
jgi:glycosyltransferase involved in cell wall biosynthesis